MDIERLNINVRGKPSVGFGGSASVFREVASYTGKSLPEDYVRFIRTVDGGHPGIGSFTPRGGSAENTFDINSFYSFENPKGKSVRDAIDRWQGVLGPAAFPIGQDGGGNQIYLDLSNDAPSVWIYVHDEGELD